MADPKYLRPGFDFALAHFIEEAGEALAAAGKTLRWGRYSANPELPEAQRERNEDWLLRELADVEGAIARLRLHLGPAAMALLPSLKAPCTHPARSGRHETYVATNGTQTCRACGATDKA